MTKMLSDGRVQHDAVVGRCPKDECAGDLVAVTGWGAWTDERCVKCNCTWCYQVPRPISDIAGAEAAEKKRRAAAPDLAGQIVSLKDHLRIAYERADKARDILRRIVDACDEEDGEIDSALIDEARECIGMASACETCSDGHHDVLRPCPGCGRSVLEKRELRAAHGGTDAVLDVVIGVRPQTA